jgi:hypothetical protein
MKKFCLNWFNGEDMQRYILLERAYLSRTSLVPDIRTFEKAIANSVQNM